MSETNALDCRKNVQTLKRYNSNFVMNPKRATVYLDSDVHRALKLKAAQTDQTISSLVNNAVKEALAEDAEDLQAFENLVNEPTISFEDFVSDLKKRGRI